MASKHMIRSQQYARRIESYVNQALKLDSVSPLPARQPYEVEIPEEIKGLGDSELGKELHRLRTKHLKRNGERKLLSYRKQEEFIYLRALELEWQLRLPKLIESQEP